MFECRTVQNIRELFDELLHLFADTVVKDKVALYKEVEGDVPMNFITDPVRVKQVLINIFSNAVNYAYNGSILLSAKINEDRIMEVTVKDTGIGINKESQQDLFNLFNEAKTYTSCYNYKSIGLGLTISNSFVKALGGTISFESTLEKGSTFSFTIKELPAIPTIYFIYGSNQYKKVKKSNGNEREIIRINVRIV